MGDWVVIQTNGIGSKTIASSVVAIDQHDPKKIRVGVDCMNHRRGLRQAVLRAAYDGKGLFEPLSVNTLATPGFGGRVYYPTGKGVVVMQVMPGK